MLSLKPEFCSTHPGLDRRRAGHLFCPAVLLALDLLFFRVLGNSPQSRKTHVRPSLSSPRAGSANYSYFARRQAAKGDSGLADSLLLELDPYPPRPPSLNRNHERVTSTPGISPGRPCFEKVCSIRERLSCDMRLRRPNAAPTSGPNGWKPTFAAGFKRSFRARSKQRRPSYADFTRARLPPSFWRG